MLKADNIFL